MSLIGLIVALVVLPARVPTIVPLLKRCSPTTVSRFIMAVVVDPVKAQQSGRTRPHVGKKPSEVQPMIANLNAATAVAGIRRIPRVQTAAFHCSPDGVDGRSCVSVRSLRISSHLPMQASTTLTDARSKMIRPDSYDPSAFALAPPVRSIRTANRNLLLHRESSENTARNIG